jgi:integrase
MVERCHAAVGEIVRGNAEPWSDLFSHEDDVSLGNPFGPFVLGFKEVVSTVRKAAELYSDGELVEFDRIATHEAAGDRLEALYVLALTTGMRQGELFRLRWADVDLEGHALAVRGEPKTAKSRRQVLLSEVGVEALRRHAGRQAEECRAAGNEWREAGLVFANAVGGSLTTTNVTYRSFRPLLERAGLPVIRFHDLRHTAATLLLGKGIHPKVVSELLGHSQVGVTLDLYSHVTPTMHREAVGAFDDLLKR